MANSTGNVFFLGFSLARAPGLSLVDSLLALIAFVIGAAICGKFISIFRANRAKIFSVSTTVLAVFLSVAVILSIFCPVLVVGFYRDALVATLGAAMGAQNAAARSMAVPGPTTTVLTLTITGIGADNKLVGGSGSKPIPRLISIAVMLIGALVGATLSLYAPIYSAPIIALVAVSFVAGWAALCGRSTGQWTHT